MLPQDFLDRMREMLGDEYPAFIDSYKNEKYQALRLNPQKASKEPFEKMAPFALEGVPWAEYGYYYGQADRPGKHPYHEAGVYYIQEPSAMAPAEYLAAKPSEYVLDLCAAPGGKTTQIAAAMGGEGLLVTNEIHPARAKILSENVERMGITNALVTNETPQRLSEHFPQYFDRIMVDAPCSGEGMFRKNEEAGSEWSMENVEICASRQDEILDCADVMLRAGGRIVYSTCTFAPAENEGSISRFLQRHPEYEIAEVMGMQGMSKGRPEWGEAGVEGLEHTIRLWPHKLRGEGHYVAVLQKSGDKETDKHGYSSAGLEPEIAAKECKEYLEFASQELRVTLEGGLKRFGEQLYLMPKMMPSLKGLKVLRPGLHLGTMKKNRFEPSHALALALRENEAVHTVELSSKEDVICRYINGETFAHEGEKGWYLITVDGYSIGWGKLTGGIMKNHYPKGLRKNIK